MAEYLVILSHGIVQFFEVGFCFLFQPELHNDEVNFSCRLCIDSTCAFWSCSIAKSSIFLSLSMLPLDNLKNK